MSDPNEIENIKPELIWDGDTGDEEGWKPPDTLDVCAYCGTKPQDIGLHCVDCWNDLADEDERNA
jgi:hypothetical protein